MSTSVDPGWQPAPAPSTGTEPPDTGPVEPLPHRRFYLTVRTRFAIATAAALAWAGFSAWISIPWVRDLGDVITLPAAILVVVGIAIIPGYLNVQLVASILLDRPRALRFDQTFPEITLLVAAYNEASAIAETLRYALSLASSSLPRTRSRSQARCSSGTPGRICSRACRNGTTSSPSPP